MPRWQVKLTRWREEIGHVEVEAQSLTSACDLAAQSQSVDWEDGDTTDAPRVLSVEAVERSRHD